MTPSGQYLIHIGGAQRYAVSSSCCRNLLIYPIFHNSKIKMVDIDNTLDSLDLTDWIYTLDLTDWVFQA